MTHQQKLYEIKMGLRPKECVPKPKKPIAKQSAKKRLEIIGQKESGEPASKLEMDKWFMDIKLKHFGEPLYYASCMECGEAIPSIFSRHATAHLLPKKLFKSVATHPLNYLILGAGCGCHEKSHRIDKFIQLKCWPEAARRIKEMIPLLPTDELKYLSSQLMTALENT